MPRLVILASAAEDLVEIQEYIGRDNPVRAIGFTEELVQQCEKLAGLSFTQGRARPELLPDLRSSAYRGYVILFRYTADAFEVVNILERHRDIDAYFSGR
jgi:plasmid stabilization system protein ParE